MSVLNSLDPNSDLEYKFILIGDTSVGKTCLFKKITSGIFLSRNVSTVGIDRKAFSFECEFDDDGNKETKNVTINLIDTAGQERYQSITNNYYKGSNGVLLIYDITDKKSFEHLNHWVENIKSKIEEKESLIFLLGTKKDLADQENQEEQLRQVTTEEAKSKCIELGLEWGGECSNKDFSDQQFKDLFKEFTLKIYKKVGFVQRETISNLNVPAKKKRKFC